MYQPDIISKNPLPRSMSGQGIHFMVHQSCGGRSVPQRTSCSAGGESTIYIINYGDKIVLY